MTYENAVEKIHSLLTFGSRPGLDRMRILLDRLGNPQDRLKFIHIAGTNGKGSVCAMLSSALVAAGYKTGLFISPYITDFRERIQINNCMVSESVLTDIYRKSGTKGAKKEVGWWQTEHINSECIPMMNRRFCLLRLLAV